MKESQNLFAQRSKTLKIYKGVAVFVLDNEMLTISLLVEILTFQKDKNSIYCGIDFFFIGKE